MREVKVYEVLNDEHAIQIFDNMGGFTIDEIYRTFSLRHSGKTVLISPMFEQTTYDDVTKALKFMQENFTMFKAQMNDNYKRLFDAFMMEYNPIENYDRIEDTTESTTNESSENGTNTQTNTKSGSDSVESESVNTSTNSGSSSVVGSDELTTTNNLSNSKSVEGTTTTTRDFTIGKNGDESVTSSNTQTDNKKDTTVKAYFDSEVKGEEVSHTGTTANSGSDVKEVNETNTEEGTESVITANTESGTDTGTVSNVGSNNTTTTNSNENETNATATNTTTYGSSENISGSDERSTSGSGEMVRKSRIHGNIGVSTPSDMLTKEIAIRKLNLLQMLVDSYAELVCTF